MLKCAWCGAERERMTIWHNPKLDKLLCLCFRGCQNFPEPFRDAGSLEDWIRIDPWKKKRGQPRLRHKR